MAGRCAVVAPHRAYIREIVADGETALLIDPQETGALEAALVRLIGDATLRKRLGWAARRRVETRPYTWDGNAARIEAVAETLVRLRAGRSGNTAATMAADAEQAAPSSRPDG